MQIERYKGSRFFAVYDDTGELIVVTVYKRGAREVVRRLSGISPEVAKDSATSLLHERKMQWKRSQM